LGGGGRISRRKVKNIPKRGEALRTGGEITEEFYLR